MNYHLAIKALSRALLSFCTYFESVTLACNYQTNHRAMIWLSKHYCIRCVWYCRYSLILRRNHYKAMICVWTCRLLVVLSNYTSVMVLVAISFGITIIWLVHGLSCIVHLYCNTNRTVSVMNHNRSKNAAFILFQIE